MNILINQKRNHNNDTKTKNVMHLLSRKTSDILLLYFIISKVLKKKRIRKKRKKKLKLNKIIVEQHIIDPIHPKPTV